MKKILFAIFILLIFNNFSYADTITNLDDVFDIKENAFALYNTNHVDEAYSLLNMIDESAKDEEIYLILGNIENEKGKDKKAVENYKKAIGKNDKFYRAYYNLGLIYMEKRMPQKALESFQHAYKLNKENPYILYNLGCAELETENYSSAKRHFTKAIFLKNDEKDFYYNLAFANKKLNKTKETQKIIDFYNENFVK